MKLSIKTKILGITFLPMVLIGLLTTLFSAYVMYSNAANRIEDYRSKLLIEEKIALSKYIDIAYNAIDKIYQDSSDKNINSQVAQKMAMELIRSMRYGENGYFWINDFQPTMLMHPFQVKLEGKFMGDFKDYNGLYLFQEFVNISKKQGQGVVSYTWSKPGSERPQPKISFVKAFPQWKWIIGTGSYVDKIEIVIQREREKIIEEMQLMIIKNVIIGSALSLIILVILLIAINRYINRPIKNMVSFIHRMSQGHLEKQLELNSQDELGEMSRALNGFVKTLQVAFSSIHQNSESLSTVSYQLSATTSEMEKASDEVNEGTEHSASSVLQTSANIKELADSLIEIKRSVKEVEKLAREAQNDAQEGTKAVQNTTKSIRKIAAGSKEIGGITNVIAEIASQTNILSLNAAIEAS
ncbi:MAG: hypothetical protein COB67_12835, partial [SAR324 cluster bacterium]